MQSSILIVCFRSYGEARPYLYLILCFTATFPENSGSVGWQGNKCNYDIIPSYINDIISLIKRSGYWSGRKSVRVRVRVRVGQGRA